MDSDLSDIQKLESALGGGACRDNESSEYQIRCDSADDYSVASSYQQHLTPQADHSFSIFEELTSESVDENRLIIDQLEPSLENALCLNKAYQAMLIDLSQQLEVLLIINQQKQKTVREEIDILVNQTNKKADKPRRKKLVFSFFGMPYFKDLEYNCAPKNEDALLAESIGFRNISLVNTFKPFSKFDLRKLRIGLKEQALTIEANRLMKQREELQSQLTSLQSTAATDNEKQAIEEQIESIQRQIYDVNSLPDDKLFDLPPTMFDWQKVAIENFRRARTPDQLRLHWTHHLRPGVNTRQWTIQENKQLKELVKKYDNGVNWAEVAASLNSNRTVFDCFRRFQERFNSKLRKFGWSKEDNLKLLKIISNYSDKTMSEIDWEEVRLSFPGRSKTQIYAYYTYLQDFVPFNANEDIVILEGVKMGYDLSDISLLLGKRSLAQVRYRYRVLQKNTKGLDKSWTEKENNMLLAMKSTSQLQWHVIKKHFPGRTFPQLFSRYHYLRMKFTTPQKYIEELKGKVRATKTCFPKDQKKTAQKIVSMLSNFGYEKKNKTSLKSTIPILTKDLLGSMNSRQDTRARASLLTHRPTHRPHVVRKSIVVKEKELKEILRPLMSTSTRRQRKLSFPGDGREHGIILTCLYRLLQCNFTRAPTTELSEDEIEVLGIPSQHVLAFANLMKLVKDIARPNAGLAPETILCLPPTLNTLTGFRGLLLHRKYLQSSASCEYTPPGVVAGDAAVTECSEELTEDRNLNPDISEWIDEDGTSEPSSEFNDEGSNHSIVEAKEEIQSGSKSQICYIDQVISIRQPESNDGDGAIEPSISGPSTISVRVLDEPITEDNQMSGGKAVDDDSQDECVDQSSHSDVQEEEDYEQMFGDPMADSLLLSRMLTVFYWPGIMSTMDVPDELWKFGGRKTTIVDKASGAVESDPLNLEESVNTSINSTSSNSIPTNSTSLRGNKTTATKASKKELKQQRRQHMKSVVRRRYGLPDKIGEECANLEQPQEAIASTESIESESIAAQPPAKKCRTSSRKKRTLMAVPQSDRVTRTRQSRGAT